MAAPKPTQNAQSCRADKNPYRHDRRADKESYSGRDT